MKFGFCTNIGNIKEAVESGFDYIELPVSNLKPDEDESEFIKIKNELKNFSIKPEVFNCFIPGKLKITGENLAREKIKNYLKVSIRRAKEVGGEIIVFGSGGARQIPENFPEEKAIQQIKDFLNLTSDVASDYGITIVIEPLGPSSCNIINTTLQANKLVEKVNRKEIKLLADLRHMKDAGENLENLNIVKENLRHIHICDGICVDGKNKYVYPGEGNWEIEKFINILKGIKYDNRISLEHCEFKKDGSMIKW